MVAPVQNRMMSARDHQGDDFSMTEVIPSTGTACSNAFISIGLWMVMMHSGNRKAITIDPTNTIRFSRWKVSFRSISR